MTDEQRRTNEGVGLKHPTVVPANHPRDDDADVLRDLELTEISLARPEDAYENSSLGPVQPAEER